MTTELLIATIAFLLGIVTAYLCFRQQISAIEGWWLSWRTIFLKDEDMGEYEGIQ